MSDRTTVRPSALGHPGHPGHLIRHAMLVAILVAGFSRGLGWQMGIAAVLLLAMFAGFARHVLAMTVGADPDPVLHIPEALMPDRPTPFRQVPVGIALGLSAVLAFAAWPLVPVLTDAVAALGAVR